MDKKHKRSAKKRNAKKSNRPASPKLAETKQTLKPIESKPTTLPTQQAKLTEEKSYSKHDDSHNKKPVWRRGVVMMSSLVVLLLGVFGYDALWPKVMIEPSQAIDSSVLSYQFDFRNQPCYPIEIFDTVTSAVDVSWGTPQEPRETGGLVGIGFMRRYTNVRIGGGESITLKIANMRIPQRVKLNEGSKIIVKITYKLPLIHIKKTDAVLFEAAEDSSGNPIWIKKPMGQFANYQDGTIFFYDPQDPQTGIY